MNTQTLSFSQLVKAPPAEAYRAFTNATALREWLCDVATAVPRPGGRLYLWWNSNYYTSGEYLEAEANQKVAFTWYGRGEPGATRVQVTFAAQDGATLVSIEHSGIGTAEEWSKTVGEIEFAWKRALENLASVLETGEDQRFTLRPMLGIFFGEFNPERAKKLGVPVSEGACLDGVVEGMGAQAAGLQKDDVIVSMADYPIPSWDSLAPALQRHRAGDEVEVVYYRGPQKKTVTMQLSRRPIPEIPPTAKALAALVKERYQAIESDLEQFLAGVTETEASFKPGPDEWSIKGNLAHLIQGERGSQNYIDDLINSQERFSDDYGSNVYAHVDATLAAYPTLQELTREYYCAMAETVEYLARLPDEFIARKSSYWRLAEGFLEENYHYNIHKQQLQATLEAARKK